MLWWLSKSYEHSFTQSKVRVLMKKPKVERLLERDHGSTFLEESLPIVKDEFSIETRKCFFSFSWNLETSIPGTWATTSGISNPGNSRGLPGFWRKKSWSRIAWTQGGIFPCHQGCQKPDPENSGSVKWQRITKFEKTGFRFWDAMGLLSRLETLHVEWTLLIWKELGFPMVWFPNAGKYFAPK